MTGLKVHGENMKIWEQTVDGLRTSNENGARWILDYAHKTSQVISVKHFQYSQRIRNMSEFLIVF